MKRKVIRLVCSLFLLWPLTAGTPALAALTEFGQPPADPHGYPLYYGDANGLRLELCRDTNGKCIFDADLADPVLGVEDEAFWWMAVANAPGLVNGGGAQLTLALEAAFGGEGTVQDGQQISFGRVRTRIDVAQPGTYRVTHPYGQLVFEDVTTDDGINYVEDIGGMHPANPAAAFSGALASKIGPFLTWDTFNPVSALSDPLLVVANQADPNAPFQYVGDNVTPHRVKGSPTGNNFFRIERLVGGVWQTLSETDLFTVTGKVLHPATPAVAHVYPDPPAKNLFTVGPVNRIAPFPGAGSEFRLEPRYPLGFPFWYQDTPDGGTTEGIRLTLCPGDDPMCISAPIDFADIDSVRVGVGEEAFWWVADAFIQEAGIDGQLTLAQEAAFAGTGEPADGNQMAFARVRIRIDVPEDGDYIVTHPYGVETFNGVDADEGINFTRDVGAISPLDPDGVFDGALYGDVGPFLTWPDFATDTTLQRPLNPGDPLSPVIQYVGDPAVPHIVTGSTFIPEGEEAPANYFRIVGPGVDVDTDEFVVQGKVFNPATFATFPVGHILTAATAGVGKGRVVSVPAGIDCGGDCNQGYPEGTQVTLTAVPDPGFFLESWSGDCTGTGACTVTMDAARSVTAAFLFIPHKVGTYRQGTWFLDNGSGGWDGSAVDTIFANFGAPNDIPVPGDWNGDGRTQVGTFRQGTWFLDANGNGGWDGTGVDTVIANFGAATDKPVAGDVDGDGISEVGVYRSATGQWFFDLDNDGWTGCQPTGADLCLTQFGAPGDIPVTGDWDGNGTFEVGVYRNGAWYLDANGDGQWDSEIDTVYRNFGAPADIPVTGDWNGDGKTQVGAFRQGAWFLDNGNGQWDEGSDAIYTNFGAAGDIPVTYR